MVLWCSWRFTAHLLSRWDVYITSPIWSTWKANNYKPGPLNRVIRTSVRFSRAEAAPRRNPGRFFKLLPTSLRGARPLGGARLPSQPWRSPATARAGCPPPAPSGAAGWSRWCPVRRWGCALCSCRWRSLRPGGRAEDKEDRKRCGHMTWSGGCFSSLSLFSAAPFFSRALGSRPADSAVRPLNAFCKHISWAWVIPSPALRNAAAHTERSRRASELTNGTSGNVITTRWKIPVFHESGLKVRRRDYLLATTLTTS